MSRKGNCLDNAVAENFFALLKTEMYHHQNFEDTDDLIAHIDECIEYYNTKRIKRLDSDRISKSGLASRLTEMSNFMGSLHF
ncbi:IS3 family transposase [Photobacterium damselae]|nr:IS3 family transposase [Photobacterium damselae]